jgi:hypothetical protein
MVYTSNKYGIHEQQLKFKIEQSSEYGCVCSVLTGLLNFKNMAYTGSPVAMEYTSNNSKSKLSSPVKCVLNFKNMAYTDNPVAMEYTSNNWGRN